MSTWYQIRSEVPSTRIADDGWRYNVKNNGADGSMRLIVRGAANLRTVLDRIAGKPATALTIGGVSTTRMIPLQFPYDPTCYAVSASAYAPGGAIASASAAGTTAAYGVEFNIYYVDIDFETPKWTLDGSTPMVSFDRDTGGEMRTNPGFAYKYPSDGLLLAHNVGDLNLQTAFSLSFEGLTSLNNTLYDSLVGCVNSSTFYNYPIGSVLYLGCSSSGQYTIGGVPAFRAAQKFVYSRIPHRLTMRPDGAGYEAPVRIDNTSKFLFDSSDLNQLYN